jgi:MFS family permease
MAIAMAVWPACTGFWPLLTFAFVYGLFYGAWVAIIPAVVMDFFGGRSISAIIGALYTSVAIGTLIGPSAAGYAFDASGSYLVPILAGAGASLLAAAVMAAAGRAARRERRGRALVLGGALPRATPRPGCAFASCWSRRRSARAAPSAGDRRSAGPLHSWNVSANCV